jgi:hypothetical protein
MLSEIQVQMLRDRCPDPATYTYAGIKQKYQITRDNTVRPALFRTACGLFWEPALDGHRDSELSPLDEQKFGELLYHRGNELNSISSRDARPRPDKSARNPKHNSTNPKN